MGGSSKARISSQRKGEEGRGGKERRRGEGKGEGVDGGW